jgi:hypothetical protein
VRIENLLGAQIHVQIVGATEAIDTEVLTQIVPDDLRLLLNKRNRRNNKCNSRSLLKSILIRGIVKNRFKLKITSKNLQQWCRPYQCFEFPDDCE